MQIDVRELIEADLSDALASGLAAEEALAAAAGLLSKAEKVFSRLSDAQRSARRRTRKRRRR
jgi:hypothetical protein